MSNKVLMGRMAKAVARVSKGLATLQITLKELGKVPSVRGRKAAKGRKVTKVAKVKKAKGKRGRPASTKVKVVKSKGRMGRPKGSKNKATGTTAVVVKVPGKHRGRPKGSKNRMDTPVEPSVAELSKPVAPTPIFVTNPSQDDSYRPPPIN